MYDSIYKRAVGINGKYTHEKFPKNSSAQMVLFKLFGGFHVLLQITFPANWVHLRLVQQQIDFIQLA